MESLVLKLNDQLTNSSLLHIVSSVNILIDWKYFMSHKVFTSGQNIVLDFHGAPAKPIQTWNRKCYWQGRWDWLCLLIWYFSFAIYSHWWQGYFLIPSCLQSVCLFRWPLVVTWHSHYYRETWLQYFETICALYISLIITLITRIPHSDHLVSVFNI